MSSPNYVWMLPSGGFWCDKKDGIHSTKIPSTPYINRAKVFPSIESAKFMKPDVSFPLTLCKMTINIEIIEDSNENQSI